MCVVLVYCLTLRMTIFENFLLANILLTLQTKHYVIRQSVRKLKAEMVQSDTVG